MQAIFNLVGLRVPIGRLRGSEVMFRSFSADIITTQGRSKQTGKTEKKINKAAIEESSQCMSYM